MFRFFDGMKRHSLRVLAPVFGSAMTGALIGASVDIVQMALGDPVILDETASCALVFGGMSSIAVLCNEVSRYLFTRSGSESEEERPLVNRTEEESTISFERAALMLALVLSVPRALSAVYSAGNASLYTDHLVSLLEDIGCPLPLRYVVLIPVAGLFSQIWYVFGEKIEIVFADWQSLLKRPLVIINSLLTGFVKGVGTAGAFYHLMEGDKELSPGERVWLITPASALLGVCYFINESVMFIEHHKQEVLLPKPDSKKYDIPFAALIAVVYGLCNGALYFDSANEILPSHPAVQIILGCGAAQVSLHVLYVFYQKLIRIIDNMRVASQRPGKIQIGFSANTALVKGVATGQAVSDCLIRNLPGIDRGIVIPLSILGGIAYTFSEFSLFATHKKTVSTAEEGLPESTTDGPANIPVINA